MADKEDDIPVKVVDRRWWVNQDRQDSAAATAPPSLKPTYVEELEQQLAEKDRQLQDAISRYRQASNDFDESRLRLRREIAKDIERGRREILADLLEVVDNLDRALDAAKTGRSGNTLNALLQGVEMVRRQFLAKLEGFGVTRIESEGEPFDPALHEAVSAVPAASADQDGRVIGVIRHGYRIGEEILRPAAVAVATTRDADS
ncbi:MAG: nucleotide exchange factor GrpE [Vicinamibacterales bacterium]